PVPLDQLGQRRAEPLRLREHLPIYLAHRASLLDGLLSVIVEAARRLVKIRSPSSSACASRGTPSAPRARRWCRARRRAGPRGDAAPPRTPCPAPRRTRRARAASPWGSSRRTW